jgi:long-chain acyl-CoA synthetase
VRTADSGRRWGWERAAQPEVEKVNGKFARVETLKSFRLIEQALDSEDEELTPTMKLKRALVNVKSCNAVQVTSRSAVHERE